MSHSSSWLDPNSTRVAVALAIFAAVANGIWIFLNNTIPYWDQAHYLWTTLEYQHAFENGGLRDLLHSIRVTDPEHGPLFTVLMLPLLRVFGPGANSGMVLNLLIAPIFYFAAGEIAWIIFRTWVARLLTIFLVATMPLLVGLFHNVLQDFLLVTLTTLSLLLLLKSEGFHHRWMTWAMALTMGLGTLTKVTFPAFVAGPLLVVVAGIVASKFDQHRDVEMRFDSRAMVINLGGAALIFLAVVCIWYGPNLSATIDYVRSTTSGPLSEGAGPSDPLAFHAIASFTLGVINSNLSWAILLPGLIALALNGAQVKALVARPIHWQPIQKLLFLLAWAAVPYLFVATAHNQDVRLMAPALPAVAILVAGMISKVRLRNARFALTSFVIIFLSYQTLAHTVNLSPGFLPKRAVISIGPYVAFAQLNSEPIGLYQQLPGDDYATPVIKYIEMVASSEQGGMSVPRLVCLLQSEAVVNSNTFLYLNSARRDPFVFTDILIGPQGKKGLEEDLSDCDFALYVKQAQTSPAGEGSRVALVNEPYAANHMSPRLLRLFRGPSRTFPIVTPRAGEDEPEYLNSTGGELVRVLTKMPSGEG